MIGAKLRVPAALAALSVLLLAAGPAVPERGPSLTGISTGASGNLLVSPLPDAPPGVLEITADGDLARTWPSPDGEPIEVVDADPTGRPIVLNARDARIHVLGEAGIAHTVFLATLKGIDPRGLAPFIRSGPGGTVAAPMADGSAFIRIPVGGGDITTVKLAGTPAPVADFDVADDGRVAILDGNGKRLRLYGADGSGPQDIALGESGFFAIVRFVPGSNETWVLELPETPDPDPSKPAAALLAFDAKGKRIRRLDRTTDGKALESTAGIAPYKDGVWLASLSGEARRVDAKGAMTARFDVRPAPRGLDWAAKRRLEKLARGGGDTAPLQDVIDAIAVLGGAGGDGRRGDALWERLAVEAAAAAPLAVKATEKGTWESPDLATFFVKTKPGTRATIASSFKSESRAVRLAAVAVLRDPAITGFDAELAAATKDTDPEIRAATLVIYSRNRWSAAAIPLLIARLDDAEPEVATFASQILGSRLDETVDALAKVVRDAKASKRQREAASRTLLLDFQGGNQVPPLAPGKRAPLRALTQSTEAAVRKLGALALVVHADPQGPAALEKTWSSLDTDQKRLALLAWSPATGDAGANALIRILSKDKNQDLRTPLFDALARHTTGVSRAHLMKLATTPGGDELDRALAIERVQRRLSDAQIVTLSKELPQTGGILRRTILRLVAARGVTDAAPQLGAVARTDAERAEAFGALYRLGSTAGVPAALARVAAGTATADVELSYLAAVGGIPDDAKPTFREMAAGTGRSAILASEALARSGDAAGLQRLVDAAKTDRYGAGVRDGSIVGALAALKDEGRKAATPLLADGNAATREDAALVLALIGGDACADVKAWGASARTTGVSVPAAFYAIAACGDAEGAAKAFKMAAERRGDPSAATANPEAFANLLSEILRQPDFREKSEPVLAAVRLLPQPVVQAVAQSLQLELHPAVAVPAMKYVF